MMDQPNRNDLQHDDLVQGSTSKPPTVNPIATSASISLSVPDTLEIRLVDASALSDYEVWSLLTSILSSAVVGFLVAYLQAKNTAMENYYLVILIVFAILFAICLATTLHKRTRLSAKSRRQRFRIGEAMSEEGGESKPGQ